jgi:hypothetical protein
VFSPEDVVFLESGCALIVAVVDADLRPRANRGWGLDVLAEGDVRLLLDADDVTTLDHLVQRDAIAITATSVRDLHSMQLKGHCRRIEAATPADRIRADRYCASFFTDVVETDGFARGLLQRLVPAAYVACIVRIDAVFDQTPGPAAGTALPLV